MSIVNKVMLIGRLGQNIEIRSINQGQGKTGTFNLATDASYRNRDGEWVNRADWHRIVTYQTGLIDAIADKAIKGRLVAVEGELKTREYTDKEGVKRTISEIIIGMKGAIQFLDKLPEADKSEPDPSDDGGFTPTDDDITF